MVAFWRRNKDRRADISALVAKALGTQAHEFDVPAIVNDLMQLDHFHDWLIWAAINKHDKIWRIPEDLAATA